MEHDALGRNFGPVASICLARAPGRAAEVPREIVVLGMNCTRVYIEHRCTASVVLQVCCPN